MNPEPHGAAAAAVAEEPRPVVATTGGAWRAVDRTLSRLGDHLNPILVKETRQALKSKQFTLWFVLLLVACWITTIGGVALIGPSIYYVSAGGYLLGVYYAILALPLTVVVPFSAYRSLSAEQEENTRDLLEVSTLTPWQIVNGKLGSAALQVVIYLSALAPCIAFTYLLRGIDLSVILLLLVYAVLASLGLSALGLLIAASTKKKQGQVVLSVAFAGGLFTSFSGLIGVATGLIAMDPTDRGSETFFWVNLAALSLYLTTLAIVYVATAGLSTFASANRSTPLRVALLVQQATYVAWIAGFLASDESRSQFAVRSVLMASYLIAAVYWFVAGGILTGEEATLSQRVRRSLPQSWLGRVLLSWFNPGPGSGYVFAVSNLALLTALHAAATIGLGRAGPPGGTAAIASVLVLAYVASFLGLGRLVIIGLRRVAKLSLLGGFLVPLLLVLGGSGVPLLVQALSDRRRPAGGWLWELPSPATTVYRCWDRAFGPAEVYPVVAFVVSVAASLFLVNLLLAGRELRQARVAKPTRVADDDLRINPAPEARPTNPWGDLPDVQADGVARSGGA